MPHIHEKYDFTVSAFIVFKDKVLLVNHPRYDMWLPPGGHIELDEDPDEALLREIKEETGLEEVEILSSKAEFKDPGRKPLYTPNYLDVHDANPPHKHIALVYFGRTSNDNHVKSDEHTESKWFLVDELQNPSYHISSDIKFYAKKAIAFAKNT